MSNAHHVIKTKDEEIVGRSYELAQLHQTFKEWNDKHPSLVVISGSSGYGKSSLAALFRSQYDGHKTIIMS